LVRSPAINLAQPLGKSNQRNFKEKAKLILKLNDFLAIKFLGNNSAGVAAGISLELL